MDPRVAKSLMQMLEQVVVGGTGKRAAVVGYRVAGKTGTAWKSFAGGYSTDKYMATFAGLVPASHPKLATVIVIDEPSGNLFLAADVAAPVFSNILTGALRLMDIPPDDLGNVPAATLVQASDTQ
jgi:cell division protein FtsI (penicillin-binding protein 3)